MEPTYDVSLSLHTPTYSKTNIPNRSYFIGDMCIINMQYKNAYFLLLLLDSAQRREIATGLTAVAM